MTAASDWLENRILTEYLVDMQAYVALYTTDPGDAIGATNPEVTGGSYVRKLATFTVLNGVATLNTDLVWNGMPAANVAAIGVWTALTGGNMLFHGSLTAAKSVAAGDAFALPAGNLTIAVD